MLRKILIISQLFFASIVFSQVNTNDNVSKNITDKYWKLIELNGKAVEHTENMRGEPHIIFRSDESRVNGNGGCNGFFASFELEKVNRISISKIGSTQMACLNVSQEVEQELFKVLAMVDNYTLSDDGRFLSLNRARMAPLARFEFVEK